MDAQAAGVTEEDVGDGEMKIDSPRLGPPMGTTMRRSLRVCTVQVINLYLWCKEEEAQ